MFFKRNGYPPEPIFLLPMYHTSSVLSFSLVTVEKMFVLCKRDSKFIWLARLIPKRTDKRVSQAQN